jgi:hypothetical protein
MTRILASAAALGLAAIAATPASAFAPQYRAALAAPSSANRFVVRDLLWNCAGTDCVAIQAGSRPAIDCAALARQAGALRSFSVDGRPLADSELQKCNARAH